LRLGQVGHVELRFCERAVIRQTNVGPIRATPETRNVRAPQAAFAAGLEIWLDSGPGRAQDRHSCSLAVSPDAAIRSSVLSVDRRRGAYMEWWILELITVGVMIAVIAVLGPLIKRYGKSYAADVFRVNPRTGKSYLVLMDFAYYLIFGAYILFSIKWEPDTGWDEQVNAEQLQGSVVRIGGLLLLMGLLHGLNVLTLPVIGRIFTLNRQLDDDVAGPRAA
jgi:hypothetical protein